MKATYVYEIHFYYGAYGYDAENDAVVHSPVRKVYRDEVVRKGSLSRIEAVEHLEPTGEWVLCTDRPDLLEKGRSDAEGFYVSGLSFEDIKSLEEQGLSVKECDPTYTPCECGAFSKFRTKKVCEHCGKERKQNPADHYIYYSPEN